MPGIFVLGGYPEENPVDQRLRVLLNCNLSLIQSLVIQIVCFRMP